MSKIITPSQQGMAMPVSQIDPLRMVSDHLDAIIAQGVPLGYDYARISEIHRRAHIIVQTLMVRSSVSWHLPVVKQIARMAGENIDDEAAAAKIRAALEQIAKDQAERNGE
ncbi:MAG TPA: hypothetical protein VM186_14320 [Planctomycetota bacterium]|nr:hypothetical protein [Planctomycetota bacterium]